MGLENAWDQFGQIVSGQGDEMHSTRTIFL